MAVIETAALDHQLENEHATESPNRSLVQLIVTLFKLRIVLLLLFSSFGGAALGIAAGGSAGGGRLWILGLTGTLSAAGASALNQYIERKQDGVMGRTAKRPFPAGKIKRPRLILFAASSMVMGASLIAWAVGLPALAFWLLAGAVIYVGVYTLWLKPRTLLNIVIGGAAGSCAVVAGGAAVDAQWSPAVWLLGGLVFTWTPVHFWALALAYREDYRRSPYPMLPGVVSPKTSSVWIAMHTLLTVAIAILIGLVPQTDRVMLIIMGLITLPLAYKTIELWIMPNRKSAFGLFHTSNLFLAAVIMAAMLSPIWRF